jgi:hypothetical protein
VGEQWLESVWTLRDAVPRAPRSAYNQAVFGFSIVPAAVTLALTLVVSPPAADPAGGTPPPAPGQVIAIDMSKTRFSLRGGVRGFRPVGPESGTMDVRLRGSMLAPPDKAGELIFDLRGGPLAQVPWGNRTLVSAEVRVSQDFVDVGAGKRNWYRAHRARLLVVDRAGKRMYLPNISIVDRPKATDGWLAMSGRPTVDVPMPIGFVDPGFDPAQVTGLGVNVEAFNREGEVVKGTVEVRGLKVTFEAPQVAQLMPVDPAIVAGAAERAARMETRLRERCGVNAGGMAVGINLAWPTARAPNGEDMQLYGKILDGGERWWDKYWDIGEPEVAASVRRDFQGIRAMFGAGAVVRVWLFGDLRGGITFDAAGDPVSVTPRARANMKVLLDMAAEEKVVLVPVLLDFGMADGVKASGPDGAWKVPERPDLITDAKKRGKLVAVLGDFVKPFVDHSALLATDVMNEPENAAAVVTVAHFHAVQALLRELVDEVHRQGGLATVGHHNLIDPELFFHGRIASDLGQVHYYPFLESRPNPTPFSSRLERAFGPLPAGWGELQAFPGKIAGQLTAAKRAGHRLFWFWSWRGDEETADGFAVKPYGAEIKRALGKVLGRAP